MGLDIFSNPAMAVCLIQVLRQREESYRKRVVHKQARFAFKRTGRLMCRKLGVTFMRVGGKLVYLGTNPYEQGVYDD